ncbi:CipC1 protein concanamycin induced protein C [Penicillium soppii]|uniref:CipC1 protein concanamycin induced protein C n=1 Tax=Penicillium soppii TaxID=69789 RepID=UPI0025493CDE|nr:CipC1 protein concanamycin induced protein C [Penicillium soppii]KAJ5851778.1 CipC1 protein concanamycin induced protein C [Penicillium soppii]
MRRFEVDSEQAQAFDQVDNAPHGARISHELLSNAAAYEAAKTYEIYVAQSGHGPASDTGVKWTLAILVSASVDRLVETKGLEYVDKEKAKHDGILQVEEARARNE